MTVTPSNLEVIGRAWTEVSGSDRALRGDERILDDLAVDSLEATEFVVCLERLLSLSILGDARLDDVSTVADLGQLVDVLRSESAA